MTKIAENTLTGNEHKAIIQQAGRLSLSFFAILLTEKLLSTSGLLKLLTADRFDVLFAYTIAGSEKNN